MASSVRAGGKNWGADSGSLFAHETMWSLAGRGGGGGGGCLLSLGKSQPVTRGRLAPPGSARQSTRIQIKMYS